MSNSLWRSRLPFSLSSYSYGEPGGTHHHRISCPDGAKAGMKPPVLAVGDGALGFWAAVRDVFPETRDQRDRVHKTSNVLDALPKSVHSRANPQLRESERRRPRLV